MGLRQFDRRGFLRVLVGAVVAACTQTLPGRSESPQPSPAQASTPPPPTPAGTDASPSAAVADLLYVGGSLLTMDAARPVASAIAIRGDRILAVGDDQMIRAHAGPATVVVDLAGRAMLPGFNDAHCHRIGDREVWGFERAEDAIRETLANGFTSISELFVSQERLDELVALDEAGSLGLRVNAYLPVNYLEQKFGFWFEHLRPHQQMSPRVRIGGAKAFADKADPNRLLLSADHPLRPGDRGDRFWEPNELADLVKRLHDGGWQIAIHTAGDGAHDMVLDAFRRVLGQGQNDARHRIEHLMMVRDDQILTMAEMGIVASFQLGWFNTLWTQDWEGALPGLTDRLGRWRDLLDAGVPAVGSTDCPWAPPVGPAMRAVEDAVTRRAEGGGTPADWQQAQRLGVVEVLQLLTARGAWSTFEEADKGMLKAGMLADLVVLSQDPTKVEPERLSEVEVLATIVGGVGIHCATGAEALCVMPASARPDGPLLA